MVLSKDEARALFPSSKWEEITREEWIENDNVSSYVIESASNNVLFFKPRTQWPKKFKCDYGIIANVHEDGAITIENEKDGSYIIFANRKEKPSDGNYCNLFSIYEVVELSKKHILSSVITVIF